MNTLKLQINTPCKFHLGDEPNAWQAWLDDSSWEEVKLPHDWSVHMPFSKEYSSGTGYLAGGIGWYRIHIQPKAEWAGKRISITFDGVYKNSRVWCNSYYLGERPNGYISFTYDLTDFFSFDHENVISVYVDRREIADSRWFTGSGIIGKVSLNIEEKIHPIENGVFFNTPVANDELAIWEVNSRWKNDTDELAKVKITSKLIDDAGEVVDEDVSMLLIMEHEEAEHSIASTMLKPKLWSPDSPSLYTLVLEVENDGETYIAFTEKVGIRTFRFDPDTGFYLNGKPEIFKGVCLHHDAGVLGAAVPPAVWYQRLERLKKMGCNAIRMSHNPHVPELYYLCDSMGFMVMDEAFDEWEGPKNKWSTGHNVYPPKHEGYYVNFNTWGKKDLTDMVLRDRNHPSVIMWSIGNEIDYPNDPYCHASFQTMTGNNDKNKPAAERQYNPLRPDATRLKYLAKMLTDTVKEVDTTHPVTLAAAFPELSAKVGFIDELDVVGFNYRENLYKEHHESFPDKPFLGSENGHGLSQWKAVTDNDYISGQFLWTGIDYLGEALGWPYRGSSAGIMTIAGLEKTSYYRRQSFWSKVPMVHLAAVKEADSKKTRWGQEFDSAIACEFSNVSENWNYKEGEKVVVKCYTNTKKVRLSLNGSPLGEYIKSEDADCILVELDFKSGCIKAEALDENGNVVAEHELKTSGEVVDITVDTLCVDAAKLPLASLICGDTPDAFSDLYIYEITLKDKDGNRVFDKDRELSVKLEGGTILGVESGDIADVTSYTETARKTFAGQLVVYAVPDKKGAEPKIIVEGIQ